MKNTLNTLLTTVCVSGWLLSAAAQPVQTKSTISNSLTMNFVNAPLEQVLTYLSDAAGFIVQQETRVNGYVTVVGKQLSVDEALNLVNTELNKNGYAAIRDDRILTIVTKNEARTRNLSVKIGNDPNDIPNTDEIATWIIPIRFVEARQLVSDLSLFVSPQASVVANDAGNTIVVTDTQANIRHLVKIIEAVDNSAESETEIRVFRLKYASPTDVADELSGAFPSSNGSDSLAPFAFGGGLGSPFGGGGNTDSTEQRIQKAIQVTAVADSRIQAVIVTAPKDLMKDIASIMEKLDVPSDRDQKSYIVELQNSDPQQVAQVLQSLFSNGNTSSTGTGSSSSSALQTRAQNGATQMSSGTSTSSGSSGLGSTRNSGGTGGRGGGG